MKKTYFLILGAFVFISFLFFANNAQACLSRGEVCTNDCCAGLVCVQEGTDYICCDSGLQIADNSQSCLCDVECYYGTCESSYCVFNADDSDDPGGSAIENIDNPGGADNPEGILVLVVNFIFWAAVILAPIMFIIAVFYLVTASGEPEKIETAKKIMLYTAMGLAVFLAARALIAVLDIL